MWHETLAMSQLTLFPEETTKRKSDLIRDNFSHDGICRDDARLELEHRYGHLLEETDRFNRQLVSFQANKTETLHSWIKYREGFSAGLVERLIREFGLKARDVLLDPFAGSATTLLEAKLLGIDAVGIELLPHCHLAWRAKSVVFEYDVPELRRLRDTLAQVTPPTTDARFPHLQITESAFPPGTEAELMAYTEWIGHLEISDRTQDLLRFLLTGLLEDVSYTRKDGQYLRWDGRAEKLLERNNQRDRQGKEPITGIFKGELPSVRNTLIRNLDKVIKDVVELQRQPPLDSKQVLIRGNTLAELPKLEADQFSAVITSPPYANRYDYTRTYALELAYLGVQDDIFALRQQQLSCTVENRSKIDELREIYETFGASDRFMRILAIIRDNLALSEINDALKTRLSRGEINNAGVLAMIDQYFTELAFVYAELLRVCRPGAYVAFVNDNVRYAGEVIPVDMLGMNLAEQLGFEPVTVYVLPQRKGNSSQQMGKYGREALRKSITVWRKPYAQHSFSTTRWRRTRNPGGVMDLELKEQAVDWSTVSDVELDRIKSTDDETRRAVERNAVQRGILFAEIIVETDIDNLLSQVETVAAKVDKEDVLESADYWGIDVAALEILDRYDPPLPYSYYFCTPDTLVSYPKLAFYYRNIAMLSSKVMRGIGLSTTSLENGSTPSIARATELAAYFNRVVSRLLVHSGVSHSRHVQMLMANLGESLGGSSRNEVGRMAMALVMRPLIEHLWEHDYVESITLSTRVSLVPGEERDTSKTVLIAPDVDVRTILDASEASYVKYQEIRLRNGVVLVVDKQIGWRDRQGREFEASADLQSMRGEADLLWGAEVKGGADPTGSDEHWKTASRALARALEAAQDSGNPKPPLSFIGTTIVRKVALEIKAWIDRGDLVSAYNLTKIIEQSEYRKWFLDDMMVFLGYHEGSHR